MITLSAGTKTAQLVGTTISLLPQREVHTGSTGALARRVAYAMPLEAILHPRRIFGINDVTKYLTTLNQIAN
jgi:hypothetical protein